MPLMLWVSLYRIFYMGRVFNFLGIWVEKSDISLTFGDFYTQFLHLLCFGDLAQAAQTPLLLILSSPVLHVPSACHALAQLCRGAG